ncbi:hypothetical protein [Kineococcus sp. SYSU DK004]|uniref:hypothetical protein n=1 Tax=Kineococcus sp. SYSU DK004 TaxID=3383125 RepID=UPI003D7D01FC
MSAAPPPAGSLPAGLRVSADLSLQLDDLDVRVEADGTQLLVRTADAGALAERVQEAAAAAGLRGGRSRAAALARVSEELASAGLSARVLTPEGPVLDVGAGVESRFGRVVLGSPRVRLHRAGAVRAAGARGAALTGGAALILLTAVVAATRWGLRRRR